MVKNISLKIGALLLLVTTGCQKDNFLAYDEIQHNAEWLFPVAKTGIAAEDASKLDNLQYDVGALALNAPFINTGLPIPPISGEIMGPLPLEDTDSIYVQFRSNDARIEINITNNWPINIKAGVVVEIRNSLLNNDVIFRGTLQNDIPERGGTGSVIIEETATTPFADNKLQLYFVDFASDGSSSVEDFTNASIDISINVEVVQLEEVELYGNISYSVTDTTEFDFGSDNTDETNIENTILFNLLIKNGLPLSYAMQAYFLDNNRRPIDSLFNLSTIAAPGIDASGYVVPSTIKEQIIATEVSKQRYLNIRNNTQYIYYQLNFSSQPQNVRIVTGNDITLQLTTYLETSFDF